MNFTHDGSFNWSHLHWRGAFTSNKQFFSSKKEANDSNLIASEIFKAFCLLHYTFDLLDLCVGFLLKCISYASNAMLFVLDTNERVMQRGDRCGRKRWSIILMMQLQVGRHRERPWAMWRSWCIVGSWQRCVLCLWGMFTVGRQVESAFCLFCAAHRGSHVGSLTSH